MSKHFKKTLIDIYSYVFNQEEKFRFVLPENSETNPAQSPQELADAGYTTNGDYWYQSGGMMSPIKMYTDFKGPDGKPWVKVFSSPARKAATLNLVGKNIPFKGFRISKEEIYNPNIISPKEGYSYFSTYQFFNQRNNTTMLTIGGNYPGFRVFIGNAGGHGFYTTDQSVCNWPRGMKNLIPSIGAGFDGNCGSFPNNLLWGIGKNTDANYNITTDEVWNTWLWWDNYSKEEEWQNWTSPLSIDLNTIIPKTSINPPNGKVPPRSLARYLNTLDLSPFKVVTLQYLVDIGKVRLAGNNYLGDGTSAMLWGPAWYSWGRVYFDSKDKWLPVGDIIYQYDYDISTIPVLLVDNNPKYSTIIAQPDWRWLGDRYKCNGGVGMEWNQSYYSPPSIYNNDNLSIGCSININERSRGAWDNVAFYGRTPCIAAVNKKYLAKIERAYSSTSLSIGGWSSDCWNNGAAVFTSPFFTFSIWGARSSTLGVEDYYDIVPRSMLSKCCAGTLPIEIDKTKYCGVYSIPTSDECDQGMVSYCEKENLLKDDCYKYIKTRNKNFDIELKKYCNSSTVDKTDPNFLDTCSCFFNQSFYDDWRKTTMKSVGNSKLSELLLSQYKSSVIPKCEYPTCANTTSIKPFETTVQQCPANQFQQCINNSFQTYDGASLQQNVIDASQINNCVQTSNIQPNPTPSSIQPVTGSTYTSDKPPSTTSISPTSTTPTSISPTSTTPTKTTYSIVPPKKKVPIPTQTNNTLYIIIFIIIILIAIIAYFMLKSPSQRFYKRRF
jgi:hypothetical protein